jgi:hypothetical protein
VTPIGGHQVDGTDGLHEQLDLYGEAALLVDSLSPDEEARLGRCLARARALESDEVASAVDAMVAAIPPVLRGRVRKVLQRGAR